MMISVAKEDRPRDLDRSFAGVGFGQVLVRLALAAPQDRLRHHDRAIDDDAEVDRAERQEIGRNLRQVHQDEGRHQGERYGEADDQRAARTAEEQYQRDEDEADALHDRLRDPIDGRVNEIGAVDIRHDPNVVGGKSLIEFLDLGVDAVDHPRRVVAFKQQDRSLDGVVLPVPTQDAVALLIGELELAEIAHQDGDSVALGDHYRAHVLKGLHEPDAANHVAEFAAGYHAAAGAGAVGGDGGFDIGE